VIAAGNSQRRGWQRSTQSPKQIMKAPYSATSIGTLSMIIRSVAAWPIMPISSKITTMGSQARHAATLANKILTASSLAADR
jgi:hypothetical protein